MPSLINALKSCLIEYHRRTGIPRERLSEDWLSHVLIGGDS